MTHIRQQIRDAITADLKDKSPRVGTRVFAGRAKRLAENEVPAIIVRTSDEQSQPYHKDGVEVRDVQVDIICVAFTDDIAVQDILDEIAVVVESRMAGNVIDALEFRHELQSTIYSERVEGAEEYSFQTLTYEVTYHVAEGAPETAV